MSAACWTASRQTAQNVLANLITIFLGITIASQMQADQFLNPETLLILGLGLLAFIFDTAGGVIFAKIMNLFLPQGKKINPMIGACGISAFPMSSRVISKMALKEDNAELPADAGSRRQRRRPDRQRHRRRHDHQPDRPLIPDWR